MVTESLRGVRGAELFPPPQRALDDLVGHGAGLELSLPRPAVKLRKLRVAQENRHAVVPYGLRRFVPAALGTPCPRPRSTSPRLSHRHRVPPMILHSTFIQMKTQESRFPFTAARLSASRRPPVSLRGRAHERRLRGHRARVVEGVAEPHPHTLARGCRPACGGRLASRLALDDRHRRLTRVYDALAVWEGICALRWFARSACCRC
jgi:hypothetical protein